MIYHITTEKDWTNAQIELFEQGYTWDIGQEILPFVSTVYVVTDESAKIMLWTTIRPASYIHEVGA